MLKLEHIQFRREGAHRWILNGINLSLHAGQFLGLVGPNGSGKSTLLRVMSGEWKPTGGTVYLHDKSLSTYSPSELAQHRAFLNQKSSLAFPFAVEEVVRWGLFRHRPNNRASIQGGFSPEGAMDSMDLTAFAQRLYPTLSGGEACRVDIARVLVQQTPVLLLDEPTNHLDPCYQVRVLSLCRELVAKGAIVVAALHDLNLAAQHCDQLMLLAEGEVAAYGKPEEVLCTDTLTQVYQVPFESYTTQNNLPIVFPSLRETTLTV
ncbi:MAG: heme ABC transporter ATP-binding protein [Deltaproteobacteria bacterium]|nr:MAG: heme ABC transporter ATP-binding protein [Deltaproteobacteria bacterium]